MVTSLPSLFISDNCSTIIFPNLPVVGFLFWKEHCGSFSWFSSSSSPSHSSSPQLSSLLAWSKVLFLEIDEIFDSHIVLLWIMRIFVLVSLVRLGLFLEVGHGLLQEDFVLIMCDFFYWWIIIVKIWLLWAMWWWIAFIWIDVLQFISYIKILVFILVVDLFGINLFFCRL